MKILYLGLKAKKGTFHYPVIRTQKRAILPPFPQSFTHIVFTSQTAVAYWPGPWDKEVIAIGEETAAALRKKGLKPLLAPEPTQEGVFELIRSLHGFFLLPHSHRSRPHLVESLKVKKIPHFSFVLYETHFQCPKPIPNLADFEEIVFTSPSTVEGFLRIYKTLPSNKKLTPIGPITKKALSLEEKDRERYSGSLMIKQERVFMIAQTSYQLPELPYDFNALEPIISAEIMELHYTKHHKGYVTNLNTALEKYHEAESRNDVAQMIALQSAIKFNGGGHINHTLFWTILAPPSKGGGTPGGELAKMIQRDFGSFDAFKEKFNAITTAIQGSGWGWLGYNKGHKRLEIATCPNQDPLSTQGLVPLFGIDVWEHAYYLQYKNVRADYVKALWQIFYWKAIEERFSKAVGA